MANATSRRRARDEREKIALSYGKLFNKYRDNDGHISIGEGMRQLQSQGLPKDVITGIMDLSDLDLDLRLSLREFVRVAPRQPGETRPAAPLTDHGRAAGEGDTRCGASHAGG